MGRGGKRPGAGRKRKPRSHLLAVTVIPHPSVPTTDAGSWVDEFDAPNDLSADERAIWLKQAPLAFEAGTLTKHSALAFERYCKVAAVERRMAASPTDVGKTDHRGMLKQVEHYEERFRLIPSSKGAIQAPPKPADAPVSKLARFRKTIA